MLESPLILSSVRFILITRSGCSKKNSHRKETLNEKSISIVGILASDLTGPCLFPGTHKYVCFISRSLFQAAVTKCSVWTQPDTGKQIWSLEWLTQLSHRWARSYRARIGRGPAFCFLFLVLKRRFLLQRKKCPVNCAEILVSTPSLTKLTKGFLWVGKSYWSWNPPLSVKKQNSFCAMNIRKDYCIDFCFVLFLLNEEKLCLRVAYFTGVNLNDATPLEQTVLTGFQLYLALGWNLKKWKPK